jgi:hypothetical protein
MLRPWKIRLVWLLVGLNEKKSCKGWEILGPFSWERWASLNVRRVHVNALMWGYQESFHPRASASLKGTLASHDPEEKLHRPKFLRMEFWISARTTHRKHEVHSNWDENFNIALSNRWKSLVADATRTEQRHQSIRHESLDSKRTCKAELNQSRAFAKGANSNKSLTEEL